MHTTHTPSSITRNLAEKHAFSSKERDVETGLSYFGARYYSSELSIWLAVDPMSGKYPSTSPYAYCRNNPIVLVDIDGEFDTRSEARQYRKEHHTGGVVKKNNGKDVFSGEYTIENKRKGVFYTEPKYKEKDPNKPIYGQDNQQIVSGPLIISSKSDKSTAAAVLASTVQICGSIAGDDLTGIGVADDVLIPVVAVAGLTTTFGIYIFEEHKKNSSKSNWQRHSATRSGGDPKNGRYGQNRNNKRGHKNQKYYPIPNPNKRR